MNEIMIDNSRTVCFTGHRPEKLPDNGDNNSYIIKMIKSMLYKEILDSVEAGYDTFITGLARGVDLWAGEMVLEIKAQKPHIRLIAASPYKAHGNTLKGAEKWVYGNIIAKADMIVYVCENYTKLCMKMRNQYMVDNSNKLIAVVSDYKSGTGQTISYARKEKIEIKVFDINKIKASYGEYINDVDTY